MTRMKMKKPRKKIISKGLEMMGLKRKRVLTQIQSLSSWDLNTILSMDQEVN